MNRYPLTVTITFILILANAAFWLMYAFLMGFGAIPIPGTFRWIMFGMALVCSVLLAGSIFFLHKRNRIAFFFTTILLTVVAVLSITDETGPADILTFVSSLAALVLLFKDRAWYLNK